MFSVKIHEIILVVRDIEAAARFYRDVVGLTPIAPPSDGWAGFWAGSPENRQWIGLRKGELLHEEHSPYPPGERFGRVHYAFQASSAREAAFLEHFKAHGVTVYGPERFKGRMEGNSYYFYDPDGNLLEFWFPDPARFPEDSA